MRIAYVNADPGVPVFGTKGSSLHVREVIDGFMRAGATVHLFASRTKAQIPAGWKKVHWRLLPELAFAPRAQREQAALWANSDLRHELESCQAQFDLVYERYSLWSFAAMEYARERGIAGVLEVNAPLIEEQKVYRGLSDEAGAEAAMHRVFAAATNIVAVSDEVARYAADKVSAKQKIRVIPNAINPARFPTGLPPIGAGTANSFTVGFVGSLRPWHGLGALIEAFQQFYRACGSARLLIVGDGPERDAISSNVQARGLTSATTLTGAVPVDLVPRYLASMDLAIAPYPDLTNFYFSPIKVYEYMAAGKAIVASQIGQLKTLIEHGVNGWHVPPGDTRALADAMLYLSKHRELRQRLGQAAREKVLQRHTWDHVVQQILQMAGLAGETQAINTLATQTA